MIFAVSKGSSKFCVLLGGLLCILFLSLSPTVSAGEADNSYPTPIEIRDCIPHEDAGIIDFTSVPGDTSFAVLIRADRGINLNAPDAIRFSISDSLYIPYVRNLRFDTVRVVTLNDDPDERATFLWVVYDRSLEPYMPARYPQNSDITVTVTIRDVAGNILQPEAFEFRIEAGARQAASGLNIPETREFYPVDTDPYGSFDAGVEVVEGALAGARILYNSNEPLTPQFGLQGGVETVDPEGALAVGMPVNLAPHTVFDAPVKVFIPVPADEDIFSLGLAYHDGTQWLLAADAAGNVLPGGEGWMVPGSRVNHAESEPALIEIQVVHFSGVQAVVFSSTNGNNDGSNGDPDKIKDSGTTVYISCFIDSVDGEMNFGLAALIGVFAVGLLAYIVQILRE